MLQSFNISGNIIDIINGEIFPGIVYVKNRKIFKIVKNSHKYNQYIMPGLIDSHIHIESSMLPPAEFARIAVTHGTVATVSDPHEIANVLGIKGVEYMIANGKKVPFNFFFGAPSCVPATGFETSGATLGVEEIDKLLRKKDIVYLSEVMNYPGVIARDKIVISKIALAKKYGKKIDGHAPGVTGMNLQKYINSGISTDHESFMLKEGREKISLGMKVQIREGSAAKNFDELARLIDESPDMCMLCSDDRHPDDLVSGHVNDIVKRGIRKGIDKIKLLKCACLNPIFHYNLPVGLLREGDRADFIVVDNLKNFKVLKTYIGGKMVAKNGKSLIKPLKAKKINNFKTKKKSVSDFFTNKLPEFAIGVIDGQLVTEKAPTIGKDILKITVVNRYNNAKPAVAFIKGFGLKKGAIASSVAHDSHNIVAVGVSDKDICDAVNLVIKNKGGLAVVGCGAKQYLALPIAGLMSDQNGYLVAKKYSALSRSVKKLGSKLHAPFMTLAFMALLVIPKLKLSDKGLFDSEKWEFANKSS